MISIAWIAYAIGCPGFGYLSDITKRRKPYLVICAVIGLVCICLILFAGFKQTLPYEILFFGLGLAASGQSIGFVAITEHCNPLTKATALGLNNGAITLTTAVIPLLISYLIVFSSGSEDIHHLSIHSLNFGLSVLVVMNVIGVLTSLFLFKETYSKPQKGLIVLEP